MIYEIGTFFGRRHIISKKPEEVPMLFSELKKKEVINLKNCEKLGRVNDFEFDECTGQIFKLIIPGDNKWCSLFGNDPDYVICYKDIKQIGPDIIIVDICL